MIKVMVKKEMNKRMNNKNVKTTTNVRGNKSSNDI